MFLTFTCIGGQHEVADSNGDLIGVIIPVVDTHVIQTNRKIMLTTEQITTIGKYMRDLDGM